MCNIHTYIHTYIHITYIHTYIHTYTEWLCKCIIYSVNNKFWFGDVAVRATVTNCSTMLASLGSVKEPTNSPTIVPNRPRHVICDHLFLDIPKSGGTIVEFGGVVNCPNYSRSLGAV